MAQILLITRRLDSQLESFKSSLQSEQQSVHVVTTENNSPQNGIEIVSTFLRLQPDLIYFVISDEKINRLEKVLFNTLGQLPHIKVAVSFTGHFRLSDSRSLNRLLQKAELLTFSSRQCLSDMRGFKTRSKKQFRALLSPQVPIEDLDQPLEKGALDLLKYVSREKVWITFGDSYYIQSRAGFFEGMAREKTWIFIGDRTQWRFSDHEKFQKLTAQWKLQPLWYPYNSNHSLLCLFKQAEALVMADHSLNPAELSRYSQLAALSGLYTILDTHQIEPHSRLWTVGDNCELIEKNQSRQIFENTWLHRLTRNFDYRKKPRSSARAADEQLNEFNRWMTKTLAEPRRI